MDRRVYDKYVVQIAAQGSLTKAAQQLGISQPALSSGLTTLENELGFRVFDRKSVPVALTPEGRLYLDYIQRLQVLADDLQRRLDDYRKAADEHIAVGGPVAYVESLVTDAIRRLGKTHPDYRVSIKCSPLSQLIDMASKGEIGCFISTSGDLPPQFEKHLIKREVLYLCIPADDPVNAALAPYRTRAGQKGPCFDYSLLDGKPFIFLEERQPMQAQIRAFCQAHGIAPRNRIVVNQVSTAVNLAVKGEGICFASEAALEGHTDLGSVCIYSLPDTISGRDIYVAYDRQLFMPAACREFIRCLMNDAD